jgi:hypothetical protein
MLFSYAEEHLWGGPHTPLFSQELPLTCSHKERHKGPAASAPRRFLLMITSLWLVIFFLPRLVLLATHLSESGTAFASIFGIGVLYDLSFLLYAALPMSLSILLTWIIWRFSAPERCCDATMTRWAPVMK